MINENWELRIGQISPEILDTETSGRSMTAPDTAERCKDISQGYAFFAYPWY